MGGAGVSWEGQGVSWEGQGCHGRGRGVMGGAGVSWEGEGVSWKQCVYVLRTDRECVTGVCTLIFVMSPLSPSVTQVCGLSDREERLLLCDGCDLG